MAGTPVPRSVLYGAIRSAFDPVARALDLNCQIERDSCVLYAGPRGSLAVYCELAKGEVLIRLGRDNETFDLPELLSASGREEAARQARLRVASPHLLPAQLVRLAGLAHEQGAYLLAKDDTFYRKALERRCAVTPSARRHASAVIARKTPPPETCARCGAAISRGSGRYRRGDGSLCIGCGPSSASRPTDLPP